ncbi:dNTP triphosphohydrolase [Paenimyroides tangerinum]|uniref:DNTP triphosphohydrolase n=2 Tax=Paenimyroides tangerinum TaxID=2488728 RepID=A0A3P3WB82_9FLAO|nr:dNTP triphosphohydrolase [Paenimyroides tangerinum]
MMHWNQLLSLKKHGDEHIRNRKDEKDSRVGFEVDYDRIIFSNPFRSLQDKTQVIPLSKTDFVHTRLTHSLEVSVVGRSLGRLVGEQVLDKHEGLRELGYTINDFGAIVAAACLAHDIGNPPFGHSGEKAIGDFFKNGLGEKYRLDLEPKQWQDLIDFEGNANGFNVLTTSRPGAEGGLRISYATLGTFMKYPKESLPKKPTLDVSDKKYGFFQSDKEAFLDVANELGLISKNKEEIRYHRHPLAYVMEAADDICYTIIDFEDGINLGWIPEEHALEFLIKIVKDNINSSKYAQLQTKGERVSYLRALAIGSLINDAVRVFMDNEEAIMMGEFPFALTEKCTYVAQMKDIITISISNVYESKEVIQKEVIGYQVINTLLEKFTTAVNNQYNGEMSHFDDLILKMLPEQYHIETDSLYERLMNVCKFVSMLTDGKALELYQSIKVA